MCQVPVSLSPWCGIVLPSLAHSALGTALGFTWALGGGVFNPPGFYLMWSCPQCVAEHGAAPECGKLRHAVYSRLCFLCWMDEDPILLCPSRQPAGGPPISNTCGGQETPGSAAAAVPPAWPSPACPRLIPLLQTLSLTPADKSHFQDGLIQFSTDFLPGPVTYGSPAGAGQHVTPQRPPSLEQLSTSCCSLISPGRLRGGLILPCTAPPGSCPCHSHQDPALGMLGW